MKITLEDIIRQESVELISLLLQNNYSLQSAKQYINNLLANVNVSSESSVSNFLNLIANDKRKFR